MNIKPKTIVDWTLIAIICLVILTVFASEARAETKIGIHGGHFSHHWFSENVTNERHRWIGIRINNFTAGHAYNSYRQEGFSGELWYIGLMEDWTLKAHPFDFRGTIIFRGSIGIMHGYTEFGGHDPDKEPGYDGYVAPGLYYQSPINKVWKWEAGAMQFGDATLPSIGLEARF